MADRANLNSSYYGRIERGEVNVTLDTLTPIAQALNVELSDMFGGDLTTVDVNRLRNDITRLVRRLDSQRLKVVHDLLMMVYQKN